MIAGETSQDYDEIVTISMVSPRPFSFPTQLFIMETLIRKSLSYKVKEVRKRKANIIY